MTYPEWHIVHACVFESNCSAHDIFSKNAAFSSKGNGGALHLTKDSGVLKVDLGDRDSIIDQSIKFFLKAQLIAHNVSFISNNVGACISFSIYIQ